MLKPSSTMAPVTYGVDPQQYLSLGAKYQNGDRPKVMSSGELKKFAACPSRWKRGHEKKETDSLEWGSILDCVLLTPDLFEKTYAICPETYLADGKKKGDPQEEKPWNWNATACKQWRAEQEAKGMVVAKAELCSEAHSAKARLLSDPLLSQFIKESQTQVQVCVEWHDEATGIVVPLKCLIDLLPRREGTFGEMLGDLKTARSAAPRAWASAVCDNGYHIQSSLYLDAWNAVSGESRNVFAHVVQENFAPYEPARRILSEEYLQLGREKYQRALAFYCYCLANDYWPGHDEADGMGQIVAGWRIVEPEAWMITAE